MLPPGDVAQHGEIVRTAGAASPGGEKPEGKALTGPGQLQEAVESFFPGEGGSGKKDNSRLWRNGQRLPQAGGLLPPGAKDGGVNAVGDDGDGDSGQGGGGCGTPGNPAGAAYNSQTAPPFINGPETPPARRCPVSKETGSLRTGMNANAAAALPADAGACVAAASCVGKLRMDCLLYTSDAADE